MIMRNIANPQRTTLAHLEDADDLTSGAAGTAPPAGAAQTAGTAGTGIGPEAELPPQTANPRRTVLVDVPGSV